MMGRWAKKGAARAESDKASRQGQSGESEKASESQGDDEITGEAKDAEDPSKHADV